MKMERVEGLLGGKFLFKRQNHQSTKLKLYVAFVKLKVASQKQLVFKLSA